MTAVDREGSFHANITEYGLAEMETGSISVKIKATLTEMWDPNDEMWREWNYDMEADGDLWIVKKDGSINKNQVESLCKYAGWDGTIESIVNQTWQPPAIQVTVKADVYNGNTRYKISFINDYNRKPGGISSVTPEKAKEIAAKFGSPLRAIASTFKKSAPVPTGAPATPPPATRTAPPPPPQLVDDPNSIPF